MGEVDNTFLYKRYAKLYVDIFKEKGKLIADAWWVNCKYRPDDSEFKVFNNEVRRLLGQPAIKEE